MKNRNIWHATDHAVADAAVKQSLADSIQFPVVEYGYKLLLDGFQLYGW